MKKALFFTGMSIVLLLTALVGSSRPVLANCVDLLDHHAYRCHFTGELGRKVESCVQAVAGSTEGKFSLQLENDEIFDHTTLECSCQVLVVSGKVQFNESNKFLCGNSEFGDAAEGTAGLRGKSILNGQYFLNFNPDFSLIFVCRLDPSCAS